MAMRLPSALRTLALIRLTPSSAALHNTRSFQSTSRLLETPAVVLPVRKPVGAFRGGLFGFLLATALTGAGMYYWVIDEYRVSNELLMEDVYNLQAATQRIEAYVKSLEEEVKSKKS